MSQIALPEPTMVTMTLQECLAKRRSDHRTVAEPMALEAFSTVLHSISSMEGPNALRRYPSGGATYPIETYVIVRRIEGLASGAYHYRPHGHVLEHLWEVPPKADLFAPVNKWAENARAVILFTGSWWKTEASYGNFIYLLGLVEAGHMAENILLSAFFGCSEA